MSYFDEKRDFLRMPIDCSLSYTVAEDNRRYRGKVINLSSKGILFTSKQKLETGTTVSLLLTTSQPDTPPMRVLAEVERVTSNRVQYEVACAIRKVES
jgi:hypothetical protein